MPNLLAQAVAPWVASILLDWAGPAWSLAATAALTVVYVLVAGGPLAMVR